MLIYIQMDMQILIYSMVSFLKYSLAGKVLAFITLLYD